MTEIATSHAPDVLAVKRLLPWLVAVAFFMESLDTTILNTAVPAIAQSLQVVPLSIKSVLSSYTLSVAVFVPVSGWLADRFGTRHVFSAAIGIFVLGSLLCGLSGNIHILVACRVLQGLGGAMMVPVGRLTIVRTFPKAEHHIKTGQPYRQIDEKNHTPMQIMHEKSAQNRPKHRAD